MRKRAIDFRAEDAGRGRLRSSLFWGETERWLARLEGMAAELEQQAGQFRGQEAALGAAPPETKPAGFLTRWLRA